MLANRSPTDAVQSRNLRRSSLSRVALSGDCTLESPADIAQSPSIGAHHLSSVSVGVTLSRRCSPKGPRQKSPNPLSLDERLSLVVSVEVSMTSLFNGSRTDVVRCAPVVARMLWFVSVGAAVARLLTLVSVVVYAAGAALRERSNPVASPQLVSAPMVIVGRRCSRLPTRWPFLAIRVRLRRLPKQPLALILHVVAHKVVRLPLAPQLLLRFWASLPRLPIRCATGGDSMAECVPATPILQAPWRSFSQPWLLPTTDTAADPITSQSPLRRSAPSSLSAPSLREETVRASSITAHSPAHGLIRGAGAAASNTAPLRPTCLLHAECEDRRKLDVRSSPGHKVMRTTDNERGDLIAIIPNSAWRCKRQGPATPPEPGSLKQATCVFGEQSVRALCDPSRLWSMRDGLIVGQGAFRSDIARCRREFRCSILPPPTNLRQGLYLFTGAAIRNPVFLSVTTNPQVGTACCARPCPHDDVVHVYHGAECVANGILRCKRGSRSHPSPRW